MADILARRLDIVVLWRPSRGDRELESWAAFLNACRKSKTLIYITDTDHIYDVQDSGDWKTLANEGIVSAAHSDEISAGTISGIAMAAIDGRPHGKIPYGYTRTYTFNRQARRMDSEQMEHPEQAPIVLEIVTRLSRYEPVSAIASDLERRGILSSTGNKRWSTRAITRLAVLGFCYIGKRRHNGGPLLDGNWPAIVPIDIFWKANTILTAPDRRKSAPGKTSYLLSYLAKCECGSKLSPRVAGFRTPIYRCIAGHTSAPVRWLDEVVTDKFIRHIAEPGQYERYVRESDAEASAIRNEAQSERNRLEGFRQKAVDGKIDSDDYAIIASGIRENIAELERRASEISVSPALRGLVGSLAEWVSRNPDHEPAYRYLSVYADWEGMALAAQRAAIAAVVVPVLHRAGTNRLDPARVSLQFNQG
jgi:hypothetical protein